MNSETVTSISNLYKLFLKDGLIVLNNINSDSKQIHDINEYLASLHEMNDMLSEMLSVSHSMIKECDNKKEEIMLYNSGDLKWGDLAENEENIDILEKTIELMGTSEKNTKSINNLYGVKLGFTFNLPIINDLDKIPMAYYWYNGDNINAKGVYTRVNYDKCILVPLPDIIDGTKDFNRSNTSKCKYETKEDCVRERGLLDDKYNSEIRRCTFAHIGDKYNKICFVNRCASNIRFGCHAHLSNDLNTVSFDNIKNMLLYSLSDNLLGCMWFQKNKIYNKVIEDIGMCC